MAHILRNTTRQAARHGFQPFTGGGPCAAVHRRGAVRAASNAAGVQPPNIKELAKMAHLSVSDQEVKDWEPKIASIVSWFGQLQAVDVEGVAPAVHALLDGGALRPDAPSACGQREQLLSAVPSRQDAYVRVPRISTQGQAAPAGSAQAAATAPEEVDLAALQALDIRVGRIVSCERHPDADSLYVEQIDVGEGAPRTIVSGLVKYVALEQMQQRLVLVLCNLKPRNMRGIKSFGMVLAASDEEHSVVQPLAPPPGAAPGERAFFGEQREQAAPLEPNQLAKKKVWEEVAPGMRTAQDCSATYRGVPMLTSAGPVTAASLAGARIA